MKLQKIMLAAIATLCGGVVAQAQIYNELQYSPERSIFNLVAQKAESVDLRIYDSGAGGKVVKKVKMTRLVDGTWSAVLNGDLKGRFYTFAVKQGGKRLAETPGLFAKAVGVNGRRGAVIDLAETNPEGWSADVRPSIEAKDLMIYELHHRDFSIARNVNLDPSLPIKIKRMASEHPGKYLALTEPWAIGHLKSLGVNAVHILPSFDFASVNEAKPDVPQYNWGYDPLNYNVPEGSYATDAVSPKARILEFKQMVQALHKAGIKVILDVVYNHTFNIEGSNFQLTNPDAFYRRRADGSYSDGSGCGNETASEQPLMRNYILQSVKYWVDEYHIDGFRFDLMGVHDMETMRMVRSELPDDIFIYGEGWSAGSCAIDGSLLATKAHTKQMPGIAAFCDDMRDALRGPFSDDHKGAFLAGLAGEEESIKAGIVGCIEHPQVDYSKVNYSSEAWAAEPTQMIAYVSCHDDMCLVDRLRTSIPDADRDRIARLDMLAQTAVFTSQGVPFMLSGEELMRDKKGVHNSYNSPDSINQLDWNGTFVNRDVYRYYCGLTKLRSEHPAFRLGSAEAVRSSLQFLPTQDCLVGFVLKNHAGGDAWKNIYVIFNSSDKERVVEVPKANYTVVCAGGIIDTEGLRSVTTQRLVVPAQSAFIAHD